MAAKLKAKSKIKSKTQSKTQSTAKAKSTQKKAGTSKKTSRGGQVAPGKLVPAFSLPATGGKEVSRDGLKGKTVVLYFYPKDATPGCTIEGHEFTKLHDVFKSLGAEVYGISRDTLGSHEKFKTKECYSIDLLSDEEGKLCKMFDVIKPKNMYGKMVIGIQRSTFVIDGEGKLIKEWRGVKAEGHAQEVLNFLQQQ